MQALAIPPEPTMQEVRAFEPELIHRNFLKAMLDSKVKPTIHDWCDAVGITSWDYYGWLRIPGFKTWLKSEVTHFTTSGLPGVHLTMLRSALKEDATPAHRLYLERFDPEFKSIGEDVVRAPITVVMNQQVNIEAGQRTLLSDLAEAEGQK